MASKAKLAEDVVIDTSRTPIDCRCRVTCLAATQTANGGQVDKVNLHETTLNRTASSDLSGFVARFRLMLLAAVESIRLFASNPEVIEQMIVEPG